MQLKNFAKKSVKFFIKKVFGPLVSRRYSAFKEEFQPRHTMAHVSEKLILSQRRPAIHEQLCARESSPVAHHCRSRTAKLRAKTICWVVQVSA
jgi:hypothetical protein